MAVGIGFLVGIAIRTVGKGIDPVFGYVGAGLSLLGCLLGNYLTIAWFVATDQGIALFDLLSALSLTDVIDLMGATFDPMDLLFYGIAVYFGYRYSIHQVEIEQSVPAASQ